MRRIFIKSNLSNIEKRETSNFKKIFLNFDLFGTIYFPTLFQNDKQKTLYGSFLTIILFLIIIIKIIFIIYHIVSKDNYQVRTEKFSDTDIRTFVSNFSISICTDETFSVDNNVKYNNIFSSNSSLNETSEPILLNLNNNTIQCLLYELDNFTLQDSDNKDNIEYISTSIKVNKNNTISLFPLKFGFPLIYPSISNYNNPLQNRTKYIYLSNSHKNGQTIRIYLDKLQVRYKNNYFLNLFGIDKTINYTVLSSIELIDNLSIFGTSGYSFIEVYYTGWRTLYTFIAYDLDNDICAFGGFINIFFFIFNSIGKVINTIFLKKKIENSLSIKRAKTISTIFQKSNSNVTSVKNVNTINNNIMNFSLKTKDLKQNNYVDNKKYLEATQNTFINTNELECEMIKNNEEFDEISKFESQQFNKIIDYENIYQMFKDIILLELLCLNTESAKIFFKYRNNGIDLNKLEENMIDNCFSIKSINGFDNIMEKINILNKNLYCSSKFLSTQIDNKNTNNFI